MQTENEFYRELDRDQDANLVELPDDRDITPEDQAQIMHERDAGDLWSFISSDPLHNYDKDLEKAMRVYFDVLSGVNITHESGERVTIHEAKEMIADVMIAVGYAMTANLFYQK